VFIDAVQGTSSLRKKVNTFPQIHWLEHAIELKVCLVNWHINAPIPGINCNGRALGLKEICEMVEAYVTNSKSKEQVADEVDNVPWDPGMDI
jgi:hypothetical protein